MLEELGYALTPTPLLASVVTSAALLAADHHEPLARIAEGAIATLAWSGVTGPIDAAVDVEWSDGTLTGSVSPVLHGHTAEILLVAADARRRRRPLRRRPRRIRTHPHPRSTAWTPTLSFADLDFDGVAATPIALDAASALATAHRVGTLATAALQVGCAQRGLDMTVEYTKQREQFGRPIGSFQALKHRMADMLVRVQMSRAGAWAAVQSHVNY